MAYYDVYLFLSFIIIYNKHILILYIILIIIINNNNIIVKLYKFFKKKYLYFKIKHNEKIEITFLNSYK
jgi:hypothetical protein